MNIWIDGALEELADLLAVEESQLSSKAGTYASLRMFGSELRVKLLPISVQQGKTYLRLQVKSTKPDLSELTESIWDPGFGFVMQCNCTDDILWSRGCECGAAAMEKAAKACPACGKEKEDS